jgi:aspartate carbamoyltransferase regulatory subunit
MKVDSILNGIVIDHIEAGKGMKIFKLLELGKFECPIAIIKNVPSKKMGKKDIIKIDGDVPVDFDVIGYVDPAATINIIKNGDIVEKITCCLPETLKNVVYCKNPRCITSVEQEIDHIFKLTDKENKIYRCIYCETKAN